MIRCNFFIHGCCEGFSRKVIFLKCSTNNLALEVLTYFLDGITENGRLWPFRIRFDYAVESVLICHLMVEQRGANRGSFIAGPSTRNQRTERLWRDVFRCVCHFYYQFYAMEQSGILDLENSLHKFVLHFAI